MLKDIRIEKVKVTAFLYRYSLVEYDYYGRIKKVIKTIETRKDEKEAFKELMEGVNNVTK